MMVLGFVIGSVFTFILCSVALAAIKEQHFIGYIDLDDKVIEEGKVRMRIVKFPESTVGNYVIFKLDSQKYPLT